MPKTTSTSDYQTMTDELQDVIARLESGTIAIDDAVKSYQRGLELVRKLEARLTRAENTVTELRAAHDREAAN